MSPFFQLIQISLGKRECFDEPLSEEQWNKVFKMLLKQSLLGVGYVGLGRLPEDQKPPRMLYLKWTGVVAQITDKNRLMDRNSAAITSELAEMGLKSCVLKGQGTAMLYPYPETRQCGDIDLWLSGSHRKLVSILSQKWEIGQVFYHHADVKAFDDKTKLEIHFRPSWLNSPSGNRLLQRYFDSNAQEQFDNMGDRGFAHPTIEFNCIYNLIHIYRHLLQEGIGLRQLMDYYFILLDSTAREREKAYEFALRLRMKRFVQALMYVLQKAFMLEDEFLLCPPDTKYGEFLMKEILASGNFGRYDKRNKYRQDQALAVRFIHRMEHLSRFVEIAGSEVFWAPAFKTYQYVWKRLNGYK